MRADVVGHDHRLALRDRMRRKRLISGSGDVDID
jgi:hypothetical protein